MAAITENFTRKIGFFQPMVDAVLSLSDSLNRACVASREYENLSQMSDAQLASRGLDRESIGEYVVTRYLDA